MKIICISGKAQHGKDTTASFMKEALQKRGERVLITHYGDLLKYICKAFFDWDGEKDEHGRQLLQYVGTDVIRTQVPDFWVSFLGVIFELFYDQWDYVLIPDARFPNEIDFMKKKAGTFHLRVIRESFSSPLTEEQMRHLSETALDNTVPDYFIMNNGDLQDLKTTVNTWIEEALYAE